MSKSVYYNSILSIILFKTSVNKLSDEIDAKGRKFYDQDDASIGEITGAMDFVMGEVYGKNLDGKKTSEIDGKPVSQTLAQVSDNISQSKIDSQFGQAMGIENNMNSGVNYAQNAMYGEMSNQQSTKAKLDAQGGVEGAVKIDTTEAQLKAKTQEDVLDAQLKQGGAKDGLDSSVKSLAEATSKLAQTAGTLAGGKTASDIATTDKFESPERYAQVQAQKASMMATIDKTKADKSEVQEQTQAKLDSFITKANDKKLAVSQALRSGAAMMDEDGNAVYNEEGRLKASTGTQFTDALAVFGAGDMETNTQMIMGGQRVNMDTDMDGNVLMNRDSQENLKRGRKQDVAVSGYPEDIAGIAGEVLTAGIVGTAVADGVYRKFGPKGNDGIVKPLGKKVYETFGGSFSEETDSSGSTNQTKDGSKNSNDSNPTNSSESEVKNKVQDTPPNSNSTDSIPKNGAESKTTNSLMEALEQKSAKNEAAVMSEKMTTDDFVKNEMALDNAKEKLTSGGRIHSKELKGLGIDAKSMGLSIDEKGFVDIAKTDDGIAKAEAKLAEAKSKSQSASLETKPTAPTTPPESPKVLPSAKKSTASQEIFQYSADLKADAQAAQARQEAFTNAQKQRDNLLSVAETPEQIAKVNADYDAKASTIKSQYPTPQERFIDRNKNPLVSTNGNPATGSSNTYLSDLFGNKSTAEGSWMKGLFEAPGGGKAKAVATVAALTAGGSLMAQDNGIVGQISSSMFNQNKNASVAANVGNAADASVEILDPTIAGYKTAKEVSKSVGANIGKGNYVAAAKDIVTSPVAFAKNVVNDGMQFGNSLHGLYSSIGQNSSVTDSMRPSIPPHAHTAFTTPTGFNSLGVNAYNNNTSNVNTTAEEYRANNNQQIADTMDNVSINTEYAQEQGSVNSELLQQIAEQTKMDE